MGVQSIVVTRFCICQIVRVSKTISVAIKITKKEFKQMFVYQRGSLMKKSHNIKLYETIVRGI